MSCALPQDVCTHAHTVTAEQGLDRGQDGRQERETRLATERGPEESEADTPCTQLIHTKSAPARPTVCEAYAPVRTKVTSIGTQPHSFLAARPLPHSRWSLLLPCILRNWGRILTYVPKRNILVNMMCTHLENAHLLSIYGIVEFVVRSNRGGACGFTLRNRTPIFTAGCDNIYNGVATVSPSLPPPPPSPSFPHLAPPSLPPL